jgi:hypothetical protein
MRKLKTFDVPKAARLIKRLGIRDKFREIAMEANNAKDVFDPGFDFIWDVIDIATEENNEVVIYEFLAGPFEMTPEQVRDLDLDIMIANIKQLATENNLVSFFKSAAGSMK